MVMRLLIGLWATMILAGGLAAQGEVHAYCSLDAEYSSEIFADFEKLTGIRVVSNMDTEDNKTIAMVNRIISEANNPRCDVYWNNEVGHTIRLKRKGLLQPYVSPNAAAIPAEFKDKEGYWTGLAARTRVFIYNKNLVKDGRLPRSIEDLANPEFRGRFTMAKPLTGTTLTHVAAFFSVWGEEKTRDWLTRVRSNEVFWSVGNATVMRDVGEGAYPFGFTDTDDAHVSMTVKNHPTDIVVPDQGDNGLGALVIPNSVMIIKGSRNLENAQKLIDYILSPAVEAKLARGRSAQTPLHPGVAAPDHVIQINKVRAMQVDWEKVGEMLETHGPYLHQVFEGGGSRAGEKSYSVVTIIIVGALVILAVLGTRHRADSPR